MIGYACSSAVGYVSCTVKKSKKDDAYTVSNVSGREKLKKKGRLKKARQWLVGARQWLDVTRLEVKERSQLYDEDKWTNDRQLRSHS